MVPQPARQTVYPPWGDAADLVRILDVVPAGDRRYIAAPAPASTESARRVVEGSQMLAQSIVAASKEAPGRRVVSAHMAFLRPADPDLPMEFDLDAHAVQRTMACFGARVLQGGQVHAAGTLLLDAGAPDVVRHAAPAPPAPGPEESEPFDMGVSGRELRVADGAYTDDPDAPVGPPVVDAWVRFAEAPAEPYLNAALVIQFMGHMSIVAALRPHPGIGQAAAHRTLSTAINAIALSFHSNVRADKWLRYHHLSTFAGDGMTHSECRVYTEGGDLAASFTVDAMVRAFRDAIPAREESRTL